MTHTKTYFLVPGWDLPAGSISLGNIITNPAQPQLSLFQLSSDPTLSPDAIPIRTTEKPEFSGPIDVGRDSSAGLFGTFLTLFGLGNEPGFHYDRTSVLSYSFRGLRVHSFDSGTPGEELKRKAVVEAERVAQFVRASGYKAPVYMVTEVKTVRGAGVTTTSTRRRGWKVELGVGIGAAAAPDGESESEEAVPVVFAFQLMELRASEDETIAEKAFTDGSSSAELQERLDGEFGKATFTVVEGFDEEDGSSCRIIASSPACVDLLTAGSAKIDASRLRGRSGIRG